MIGLKDTLTLLKSGMTLQEIKEREELDKQEEAKPAEEAEPSKEPEQDPEEPDYKKLYEELKAKNEKTEKELTDIRKDNIHKDISGDAQKQKEEAQASLLDTVKGFM